ncbi:MAG: putative porin, partial [Candidatus Omnitrophota bacterium]
MSRRLLVICAALFLVAMAVPAFAAVQNVKVGGDVFVTGVSRNNFDLGRTASGNTDDDSSLFMSQVRLRVDADLTDNVMATIRLINERDWDQESDGQSPADNNTQVDIDLAYVTLKEMLYSPLTVVIGRQPLRYGNALIIGDPDTSRQDTSAHPIFNRDLTIRRGFDAIKAILNYDPLTIDVFFSEIDENTKQSSSGDNNEKDDVILWGVNGAYKVGDKYNSTVQGYFFQKRD